MTTRNDAGEKVRGFLVHVYSKYYGRRGCKERCATYGTPMHPLSMSEAAKVCNTGMDRGLRVVVETDGPGGKEYMSGKALVQLQEYAGPEMICDDERREMADIEHTERRALILEKANRRLIAPDIDTTGDFVDARLADNPLLAWCR